MTTYKQPVSVLVVIHSIEGEFLLLERAAHPGYWQSVTGSRETHDGDLAATARREVLEETRLSANSGIWTDWRINNRYDIFPEWRHRYAPGITENDEHLFSLALAHQQMIKIAADEHRNYAWLSAEEAAARCFSWSNRDAIFLIARNL